jgi:hypothetical protein
MQALSGGHWLTFVHGGPTQSDVLMELQKKHVVPAGHWPGKTGHWATVPSVRQTHCELPQSSGTHRQSGPLLKQVDPAGQVPSQVGYAPPVQKFSRWQAQTPAVLTQISSGKPKHLPLHSGAVAPQGGSVVVVVGAQPPPHASQQLGQVPGLPPRAAQEPASREIRQRVDPSCGTQHDTAPGFPQVDFAAHRLTAPRHCDRSWPPSTRVRTTPTAQRT